MEKQWMVAHTRPQWERIVHKQLQSWYNLEGYCPFKKIRRQYTDRIKEVEIPVFKNYVFVQVGDYKEYVKVLQLDGVVNFVKYLNKPAVVSEKEMAALKEFIDHHEQIAVFDLHVGKMVMVTGGAMKGQRGIVKDILTNKVILELPKLGFKLEARIENISAA